MRSLEGMPRLLLRLEGAAVLAGSLALNFHEGFGWLALVLLLLIGYGLEYPTAFKDTYLQRV